MANIYLRVPRYLAQFYRGRNNSPMDEKKPVVFPDFRKETYIMEYGLTLVPEKACEQAACFSQRMWQNMMKGLKPQGGKVVLKRDEEEWLSPEEVDVLMSARRNVKYKNCDYLCIQAPKTMMLGLQMKPVTESHTLSFDTASVLVTEMRRSFVCVLLLWVQKELAACAYQGVQRDVMTCIDHFFYHYNIVMGVDQTDRDSIRRMTMRWLKEADMMLDDMDEDSLFIYKKERENGVEPLRKSVKRCERKS